MRTLLIFIVVSLLGHGAYAKDEILLLLDRYDEVIYVESNPEAAEITKIIFIKGKQLPRDKVLDRVNDWIFNDAAKLNPHSHRKCVIFSTKDKKLNDETLQVERAIWVRDNELVMIDELPIALERLLKIPLQQEIQKSSGE